MPPRLRRFEKEETIFMGPGVSDAFRRARAMVLAFRFYEPKVTATVPPGGLVAGTRLDQRIRLGPLRLSGPVRVLEVWDREREAGFTYEALPGHVEVGTATFAVRQENGEVKFRIESLSAPGNWLIRLGRPFALLMQRRAVEHAFRRIKEAASET